MKVLAFLVCFLFAYEAALLAQQHYSPEQIAETYDRTAMHLTTNNKLMRNGEKLKPGMFYGKAKEEMAVSPGAVELMDKLQRRQHVGFALAMTGSAAVVGGFATLLWPVALVGFVPYTVGIIMAAESQNLLHKALKEYNRDILLHELASVPQP